MMKHSRLLALSAGIVDGLAESLVAVLPRRLAAYLGLLPQRVQLLPGAVQAMAPPGPGPVALVLDSQDVYTVDLPLPRGLGVDPWRQAAMLAHRYMPLRPELLAWDLVTLRDGGQAIARVSMVRRSVLAAAVMSAGSRVTAVTTAGAGLQPQFLRLDIPRLRRRAGRILALLAILALAVPIPPMLVAWTLDQQIAHMEQKLKGLAEDVKAVRQLRERTEMLAKVLGRSGGALVQPSRRQLLDEVARLLPDDAWLQDLALHADGLVLQGRAADPDAVLARFQGAPLFTNAHFVNPPQGSPQAGGGTFILALEIASKAGAEPRTEPQPGANGGGGPGR